MKKIFLLQLVLLTTLFVGVGINAVEAKSVPYSPGIALFPTEGCRGFENMTYSVMYKVNLYNDSVGGALLNDGDVIPTGTQIRFQDGPYIDNDINFWGMGWYSSSPLGVWMSEARVPSFDKFTNFPLWGWGYPDYYVLSVDPPLSVTATHSGTAGLSCNASGMVCTVTSPGSIQAQVVFNNRPSEKLYSYDSGCNTGYVTDFSGASIDELYNFGFSNYTGGKGINIHHAEGSWGQVMAVPTTNNWGGPISSDMIYEPNGNESPHVSNTGIPSQTIPFTLTATTTKNRPTAPTIVGPTTGITDTPYTFTLTATDPDSDTILYGIDWDSNGSVDQEIPSTDYVPSGTEQSVDHTWPSIGTYTFQALTEDSTGTTSAWTTHTITIDTLPTCTSIPTHTVVCTGDEDETTGFTGSIASTLQEFSASCTLAQRCEYLCAQGYLYAGDTCDPTQCNDGVSNDIEDTLIDMADPGCTSIIDNDEFNPPENPVLTVDKLTVIKDGTVTLTWDTNNDNEALCTLTAYSGGQNLIIADGNSAGSVDVTIPARSMYTLSCPNPLDPTAPLTDTVSIDIVPVGVET